MLPKNGCYEKTTDKINLHNAAFLGGALFLKEMAKIYQVEKGASRPIPLEAFEEFLEPFAQKFPLDGLLFGREAWPLVFEKRGTLKLGCHK